MKYNSTWFPIQPYLDSGQQPVLLLDRIGKHFVLASDASSADQELQWALTQYEAKMRVPVIAYAIPYMPENGRISAVGAAGVQIGMNIVTDFMRRHGDIIDQVDLVIGDKGHDLAPERDAFRIYMGVAIKIKD